MLETLIKIGLSEKEAKVYLAALELAQDSVQNIAKKSGVNRATTYVVLEKLMKLGLMSTVEKGKKTVFIAENPTELTNILEEQKREIEHKEAYLKQTLDQFLAVYNTKKGKPIVRYFEGADGLEALDRFDLEKFQASSEILSIIPIDILEEYFPQRRSRAIKERVSKDIKTRSIYTHKDGQLPEVVNKRELREAVFVPRESLPIDATVQIIPNWGLKFFHFGEKNFFGVLIQSPQLANNMKIIFELTWLGAKQLTDK